jgi:NDP-sugar pyrophosphorylase family protein
VRASGGGLVKAVLLAAGRGTRLGPLTESTPKVLVRLDGRTLLERQLAYLARNGVTEVALNAHHLADQLVEFVGSIHPPLPVRVSVEPRLLGTAGALLPLADVLSEPFLVLYGDVVTDADLAPLVDRHSETAALATLALYRSSETAGKGIAELEPDGRVRRFEEKPAAPSGRPALVYAGIAVLDPEVVRFAEADADFGFDVWPAALAAGRALHGHVLDRPVYDVGTPDMLGAADAALASGVLRW